MGPYGMFRSWRDLAFVALLVVVIGTVASVGAFKAAAWLMVETWK